jgi:superoxide oxidase
MDWNNTTERYGAPMIGLHWLTLLLVIAVYACINVADVYPKGSDLRALWKSWHYLAGLAVLALVAIRLIVRLGSGPDPHVEPQMPRWQRRLADAAHVALYVFMLVMPLLGWLALSASGKPVLIAGFHLPMLMGENKPLAHSLEEIHETLGTLGYFLIGLHAAAALLHHYVVRDNALRRMLPR